MFKLSSLLITIAIISGCSSANLSVQTAGEDPGIEETKTEMVNVVVVPFSYYQGSENINQNPLKQFERDVLRNLQNNYKKRPVKFFTEEQAKSEKITAHQYLKLSVDHYNEGFPLDNVTTQEVTKQLANTIARATVTTTTRTIITTGVVDVIITDSTGKNLYTDNFAVENVIKKQWTKVSGDERALDNNYGIVRDPGVISQLEPFLKKAGIDLDNKLRKYFNELW
jgi:hypothetical protein